MRKAPGTSPGAYGLLIFECMFYYGVMRRDHPNHRQRVLNQHKPQREWMIPNQTHERWIHVTVRVVWEHDGTEWISGVAKRWTLDRVWVEWPDRRLHGGGLWVDRLDVKRR